MSRKSVGADCTEFEVDSLLGAGRQQQLAGVAGSLERCDAQSTSERENPARLHHSRLSAPT